MGSRSYMAHKNEECCASAFAIYFHFLGARRAPACASNFGRGLLATAPLLFPVFLPLRG